MQNSITLCPYPLLRSLLSSSKPILVGSLFIYKVLHHCELTTSEFIVPYFSQIACFPCYSTQVLTLISSLIPVQCVIQINAKMKADIANFFKWIVTTSIAVAREAWVSSETRVASGTRVTPWTRGEEIFFGLGNNANWSMDVDCKGFLRIRIC